MNQIERADLASAAEESRRGEVGSAAGGPERRGRGVAARIAAAAAAAAVASGAGRTALAQSASAVLESGLRDEINQLIDAMQWVGGVGGALCFLAAVVMFIIMPSKKPAAMFGGLALLGVIVMGVAEPLVAVFAPGAAGGGE